ncbi:MAG: dihydrofolate reductase [Bacteroidetes bacterium]|nr:dihydrofolate reductase [Bacteroidota bacterium]
MKNHLIKASFLSAAILLGIGCNNQPVEEEIAGLVPQEDAFQYVSEKFADLQILRYQVPGFEDLSLQQKELLYYLSQAGLAGRDIIYDQNYKHNLRIRKTLENIVENYQGDRNAAEFEKFMVYAKRVWFSNGIHHHYSTKKFSPEFSPEYFASLVNNSKGEFPLIEGETKESFIAFLTPVMFDPNIDAKRVNQDKGDLLLTSANNFYEGVTQKEAEAFYAKMRNKNDTTPISYGLNSKLTKINGKVVEQVYKIGGMYSPAIEQIVFWLEKAVNVAENPAQKKALEELIAYYQTGDLRKFDDYNIAWVADTASLVDAVNGFIEVYGDAMGYRGAFESVVSFKDMEASKRIQKISDNAQWFEDNSPLMPEHKKKNVKGISAKVITVVSEAGDASPATPIGINLPNANWIRKHHGSKSVSLSNIVAAYDHVKSKGSALEEFAFNEEEVNRAKEYGTLAGFLHTDMHEVIGHASGQINPGIGTPKETLKSHASTLEEARADLVALYYLLDEKLVELGVMPTLEVGKAEYDGYIRNGLMTQLYRVEEGDNIEEAHMRNRQLVAGWAFEKGKKDNVIEKVIRNGKTYFVVRDYEKLRVIFGDLLREIQRITSEGDYEAGRLLVENYGVKVDQELLREVKSRYAKLDVAAYNGFIQPKLVPIMEGNKIKDVKVEYPDDFTKQMLGYGKEFNFLPLYN